MSRRKKYNDEITGEVDSQIRCLLHGTKNDKILRKILYDVIKNELTARQNKIIMLYYFEGFNIPQIAEMYGVTPQAVSAVMARARKRIYKIMKYYKGAEKNEDSDI